MKRGVVLATVVGLVATGAGWPSARAAGPVREFVLASPRTSTAPHFDAAVGGSVFFTTSDRLVALDTDAEPDVYRWRAGELTLMTVSTATPVTFDMASADGGAVLVNVAGVGPGDNDAGSDIYRCSTSCVLLTQGAGNYDADFKAASADLARVVFESSEPWLGGSTSGTAVYEDLPNDPPANQIQVVGGSSDVHWRASAPISVDDVFASTDAALVPDDQNATTDVYAAGPFASPSPRLVSNGTGGPDSFEATSADGQVAFWSTSDDDAGQSDTDGTTDIYRWNNLAQSLLITPGTAYPVAFDAASAHGDHAFFSTIESLAAGDTDATTDIYRWDSGVGSPTPMSGGVPAGEPVVFDQAAPDGSSVVFSAAGSVYRSTGTSGTTLLSGGLSATWVGASTSGAEQFLTSGGALYQADGAGLTRIAGGGATYDGSGTGGYVWFSTTARLSAADTDAASDLYLSRPDLTAPAVTVSAPSPQRNDGAVEVRVRCTDPAPCRTVARGVLRVPAADGSVRRFALQTRRATIAPAHGVLLHLGVPSTARHAAARALRAGRKVVAVLTVTVRDPAGNTRVVRRTVRLRS